tara:strand:+ start:866 stop:1363 length:498 start_codon:yes stop_codon:yes gene_type:complete
MWTIIKYKSQELQTAKKNLISEFEEKPIFYLPKIKYQKVINKKIRNYEKNILENYMICFHKNFSDAKFIVRLKNLKGISYFLNGYQNNQSDISNFVNNCKNYEDKDGFLNSKFFDECISDKAKFISGPFTDMIFQILKRQKNKLEILIGNKKATVSIDKNMYCPV